METKIAEVTQADREVAWKYRPSCYKVDDYTDWMAGNYDMSAAVIGGFARHRILATRTDATPVADSDETFLTAYVSADTSIIGIDHPTEAPWQRVYDAHLALRDRLNERLEQKDLCPYKPEAGTNTHPPATDVAALVDAAENALGPMAELLNHGCPEWHELNAALAPFTKGQP